MNHTRTFDTLYNYERLRKVGFDDEQAKEQTAIIAELVANDLSTKGDVDLIRNDIALIHKDITWIKIIGGIFGSIATLGITAILTVLLR
jgi:hypothetical protein